MTDALELTDTGNAAAFVADHAAEVRYVSAWREWRVWSGVRWEADRGQVLTRAVQTAHRLQPKR
jgi:phage/plasmid-associated DNA primase